MRTATPAWLARAMLALLALAYTHAAQAQPQEDDQALRALVMQQQQEIEQLREQMDQLMAILGTTGQAAERPGEALTQSTASAEPADRPWIVQREARGLQEFTLETLSAPVAPPATEEDVSAGVVTYPSGFDVTVGAHLNRAVNIADDGDNTKAYFVDSGGVPTLAYVKASRQVNDDLTVGGHLEYAIQENFALEVNQQQEQTGLNISARNFEITLDSKRYGKLWFGTGDASSFALAEIDKSATFGPNLLSVGNTAGGLLFVDKDTGELSEISVGAAFVDIESANLLDRIRYDSPIWNGFQLSADVGEDQFGATSLRWTRDVGDFDMMFFASGQRNPQARRADWRVDGGFGVLHKPSGFNLTVGAARQEVDNEADESEGFIIRGGLQRDWFQFGKSKTAIDFTRNYDTLEDGDEGTSIGAFFVQEVEAWNTEFYAGYRRYELDRDFQDLEDIDVFNFGFRFLFDVTATPQ